MIDMANKHKTPEDSQYKGPEWLREKYHTQLWSQKEIADDQDVSPRTIQHWMGKYDIETRGRGQRYKRYARFETRGDGYEVWCNCISSREGTVHYPVHRLLAVALYGMERVAGNHVHHINEIRWDNRPENIEIKSPSDHASHHAGSS